MCKPCDNARHKKWREENPHKVALSYERYREANPERDRQYYLANKEKCNLKNKRNYEKNRDYYLEKFRKERQENPDKIKKWYAAHPYKKQQYENKRRALKRNTKTEKVDFSEILKRDGYQCYLCGETVMKDEVSFDHVIPLSKGGTHTMENIKITHYICNMKKGARLLEDFPPNYWDFNGVVHQ